MKDINLRQDAPSQVSQVNPTKISEEISKLQAVQQEILNKENEIKELKNNENYISGVVIPDLMAELNLKSMKLADGSEISVGNKYFASIKADKKADALKWLEDEGHAELIKHDVKVSFPKGKYDQADKLIEVLSKNFKDIPYDEKADVHSQTLKAWAKDQYKLGKTLPEELFSVYEASIAKIKLGKEK